jgi:hypothetical protein
MEVPSFLLWFCIRQLHKLAFTLNITKDFANWDGHA